ncbi:MAG TPA: HigA family addiction module antitoxin [Bryobacteraceae bacterium]|jgi:addiction module HigA family antidote|nr:HigA family addiction module antitoxin [Bryobacteraceae bacterium]
MHKVLPPVHPGEVLREEFMGPMQISINALARGLNVPVSRVSKIVNEERAITPDTALRIARYFGTSAEFWLNLQSRYDLLVAKSNEKAIHQEVRPLASVPAR